MGILINIGIFFLGALVGFVLACVVAAGRDN
nr:MAG TPA: Protein of unknown function (DUF3789) [Caudoviricetes sp.]